MKTTLMKLSLKNFKGVKDEYVIDFGSSLTLLYGPNGFGKTTVFDSIELVLTGNIKRIEYDANEHGSKTHDSSVLHNDKSKPVIVKLELALENGSKVVVTRKLPQLSRRLAVNNFWDEIETYLSDDFDKDASEDQRITQDELEKTVFGDKGENFFAKFYRLLNYVSQSEATFFLKLKQSDRYGELSPLMDLSEDISSLNSIKLYKRNLTKLRTYVESRIGEYGDTKNLDQPLEDNDIKYERLTSGATLPVFDQEFPYKDLTIKQAKDTQQSIATDLQELKDLLSSFSPAEYEKGMENAYINAQFQKSEYLEHIVFKPLINDENARKTIEDVQTLKNLLNRAGFLSKYEFKNHLKPEEFDKYKAFKQQYGRFNAVLLNENKERREIQSMLSVLANADYNFSVEIRSRARGYYDEHVALSKNIGSSQRLVKELQDYRKHVVEHTKDSDHDCPLCGYNWSTHNNLMEAIDEKTNLINNLAGDEVKKLDELEKRINDEFLNELKENTERYLERNKSKFDFFARIEDIGALSASDIANQALLDSIVPDLNRYVIPLENPNSNVTIESREGLLESINKILDTYDVDVFEKIRQCYEQDFSEIDKRLEELKTPILDFGLDNTQLIKLQDSELEDMKEQLKSQARDYVRSRPAEQSKIENYQLYRSAFGGQSERFSAAKEGINKKEKYLENEYRKNTLKSLEQYKEKKAKLDSLYAEIDNLVSVFDDSLKSYQFKLTKPLKIPFYIYTAKILQNTPSGQGIFIKIDEGSSTVVLSTNQYTTHDALHQLSSGQLSVVSMAFLLAMNVVYNKNSAKLLIIDDPVQDMDSLNIHAFSELLRREFAHDHQMIVSTHDDRDMQYMKFTIGKEIDQDNIEAVSVQELFYASTN